MFDITNYYKNRVVQLRIAEYCGGDFISPESFTCEYLVGVKDGITPQEFFLSVENTKFFWLLNINADIFRSVWDNESTLFVLDFEYYNIKYPAEAYFKPQEVYSKIEDVYQRVKKIYLQYGLNFITIQTGQGYHFIFRVPFSSEIHKKLISLASVEDTLLGKYSVCSARRKKVVSKDVAYGFHSAGRIIEFLCHKLLSTLDDYKGLPIVFSDVSIGTESAEAVSLDLSMYADPIYMRDIRCPFSVYQKHKIYHKFKLSTQNIPPFIVLVREIYNKRAFKEDIGYSKLLSIRKNVSEVLSYASEVSCKIPDSSLSLSKLIEDYEQSKLYKLHQEFDSVEHDPPEIWYRTYHRTDLSVLPPCVNHCLYFPNDHLLKPTNLQTLTRVLLKLGWHPKHIAGLIRSKYESNYGWGEVWYKYDAASRANFYVRIYSDLVLTGIDKEEDLNCLSHYQKGYCYKPNCGFKLENYKLKI